MVRSTDRDFGLSVCLSVPIDDGSPFRAPHRSLRSARGAPALGVGVAGFSSRRVALDRDYDGGARLGAGQTERHSRDVATKGACATLSRFGRNRQNAGVSRDLFARTLGGNDASGVLVSRDFGG